MSAEQIKRMRREILVSLKSVYPAPLEAAGQFRALVGVFPTVEFGNFRQDLAYLIEKGYLERFMPKHHDCPETVPWRRRWFKLTAAGVEIADRVRTDEALEV